MGMDPAVDLGTPILLRLKTEATLCYGNPWRNKAQSVRTAGHEHTESSADNSRTAHNLPAGGTGRGSRGRQGSVARSATARHGPYGRRLRGTSADDERRVRNPPEGRQRV